MKESFAIRPDAQAFDEIRIFTVPRYKTSDFSGDEWRISAMVQFIRKGEVLEEKNYSNVETAVQMLGADYLHAVEGTGYYAGVEGKCDQEGCNAEPEVFYKVKTHVCKRCGHSGEPIVKRDCVDVRKFCRVHSKRGDCGLDDADANYELLRGAVEEPPERMKARARQVCMELHDLEAGELKARVDAALKDQQ